jgi:pimeloyl-ACP methyl ester carboxylesterase
VIQEIRLGGKTTLHTSERPVAHSQWWIVFLPGSGAQFWDLDDRELKALTSALPVRTNFLAINKPGVGPHGKINSRLFERCFRRDLRVRHYLSVLRRRIPANGKIMLLAFSEGAYLAPELAARDRRIRCMSLISGGTRSWIDEEIFKAESTRELSAAFKRIGRIYSRPKSVADRWHGFSNATWNSYDNDRTAETLRRIRTPFMTVFGSEDRMIDLDSALADARRAARVKVFKGVDHTLEHKWLEALRMSGKFFRDSLFS